MQNRTLELRYVPSPDDTREKRLCELLERGLSRALASDPGVDFRPQLSVYATVPIADGADR